MKLVNLFTSKTKQVRAEILSAPESTFKIKVYITLDTFRNFVYVSIYLQAKIFAQKRDYAIFSKLQIPRHESRPF